MVIDKSEAQKAAIDKAKAERQRGRDSLPYMRLLHDKGRKPATQRETREGDACDVFDGLDDLEQPERD